jgi:hypothetical protein
LLSERDRYVLIALCDRLGDPGLDKGGCSNVPAQRQELRALRPAVESMGELGAKHPRLVLPARANVARLAELVERTLVLTSDKEKMGSGDPNFCCSRFRLDREACQFDRVVKPGFAHGFTGRLEAVSGA